MSVTKQIISYSIPDKIELVASSRTISNVLLLSGFRPFFSKQEKKFGHEITQNNKKRDVRKI